MAGTALRGRLTWQVAKVAAVAAETASVRTITLDVPDWPGHRAGQHLDIRLTSSDVRGVTDRDIRLARTISSIAADAGLPGERASVSRLELALDSPAFATVVPFWNAVLATEHLAGPEFGDELRDPFGTLPAVWFQKSGSEEPRQRWHPDVWVDPAQVQPRMAAALAAGGTLVSDEEAPSFWVLADPEGNKVCLCTWQDRG